MDVVEVIGIVEVGVGDLESNILDQVAARQGAQAVGKGY